MTVPVMVLAIQIQESARVRRDGKALVVSLLIARRCVELTESVCRLSTASVNVLSVSLSVMLLFLALSLTTSTDAGTDGSVTRHPCAPASARDTVPAMRVCVSATLVGPSTTARDLTAPAAVQTVTVSAAETSAPVNATVGGRELHAASRRAPTTVPDMVIATTVFVSAFQVTLGLIVPLLVVAMIVRVTDNARITSVSATKVSRDLIVPFWAAIRTAQEMVIVTTVLAIASRALPVRCVI